MGIQLELRATAGSDGTFATEANDDLSSSSPDDADASDGEPDGPSSSSEADNKASSIGNGGYGGGGSGHGLDVWMWGVRKRLLRQQARRLRAQDEADGGVLEGAERGDTGSDGGVEGSGERRVAKYADLFLIPLRTYSTPTTPAQLYCSAYLDLFETELQRRRSAGSAQLMCGAGAVVDQEAAIVRVTKPYRYVTAWCTRSAY